jgi:hypothetical protein
MSNDDTTGIIYPIMKRNFDLLVKRKNPVYVKYITHPNSKNQTRLQNGHYLLLYLSRMEKSIIGYATIKYISFKMSNEIKENHLDLIQMDEKDFGDYRSNRPSKPLIFLELLKIVTLENPIQVGYQITMSGQYTSINEIKRLLGDDIID